MLAYRTHFCAGLTLAVLALSGLSGLSGCASKNDSGAPSDAGAGGDTWVDIDAGSGPGLWASTALPAFDDATTQHVLQVFQKGQKLGNRTSTFAKVGDSITSSQSYMVDLGDGDYTLGAFAALKPEIDVFNSVMFDDNSNTFNHESLCGQSGMTTKDALAVPSPVILELDNLRPAYAVVMYGTDDMDIMDARTFEANMNKLVDYLEAEGVVSAISTIPRRLEIPNGDQMVAAFNAAIRDVATTRHLPLIDFYAATINLPNNGISDDDVHPSVETGADGGSLSCDFTPTGLKFGYNNRNLLTLQVLDRFRHITGAAK